MNTSAVNPTPGYLAWKADRDARIKRTGGLLPELIAKCGTNEGYLFHKESGERACSLCAAAHRKWKESTFNPGKRDLYPCGTPAAYGRHVRRGEPTCEACREAIRVYKRELSGAKPKPPAQCGTPAGERRHRREKTPICDPCREALNKKRREDHAKRKDLENKN